MLMSVQRGLGWLIFGAQTFLNTDVMLASIATIGMIGILLEHLIVHRIERTDRGALGHGDRMKSFSAIAFARGLAGVVVLLVVWEGFARSGMYSTAMTPPIESVVRTAWRMLADGSLIENAFVTLLRVFIGLGISFAVAVPLSILIAHALLGGRADLSAGAERAVADPLARLGAAVRAVVRHRQRRHHHGGDLCRVLSLRFSTTCGRASGRSTRSGCARRQ